MYTHCGYTRTLYTISPLKYFDGVEKTRLLYNPILYGELNGILIKRFLATVFQNIIIGI